MLAASRRTAGGDGTTEYPNTVAGLEIRGIVLEGEIVGEPMSASERENTYGDESGGTILCRLLDSGVSRSEGRPSFGERRAPGEIAFRMLIDGLPANRIKAWRKASEAPTGAEAESVFRNKFELSLEDLVVLSSKPHWDGRSFGGN